MLKLNIEGWDVQLFSPEVYNTPEKQLALIEDYRAVFCSPQGVKVLSHLASKAFFDQPVFDPDERVEAQNEGMRRLFLSILRQLTRDTSELSKLQKQEGGES